MQDFKALVAGDALVVACSTLLKSGIQEIWGPKHPFRGRTLALDSRSDPNLKIGFSN